MNPSIVIPKRYTEDRPTTYNRKHQTIFVALLLSVAVITVPTFYKNFFSEVAKVSGNGLFFIHFH